MQLTGKKRWWFLGGGALLIFALIHILFIMPAKKRFNLNHTEVMNKTGTLRGFFARPEGPPAKEEIGFITDEIEILEERYKDIEKAFIADGARTISIAPVEFAKTLNETKRRLIKEAGDAGVEIPYDLGLKETIPSEQEVVIMAKELDAITFVIEEAIASAFGDVKSIKYYGVKEEGLWEKTGMELELSGKFEDIISFLYCLVQREKIYIIKSLTIRRGIGKESAARPGLRAAPFARKIAGEKEEIKEEKPEKISEDSTTAIIHLESCNYIAQHGN